MARPARRSLTVFVATALALAIAPSLGAQMPGLPVFQNAFSNPGITVAADYGSGSSANGYGAAASWAPRTGRFQFSAGIGQYDPDAGSTATAYGARFAAALFSFAGGSIGAAPFIGIGAASKSGASTTQLPVGVGFGWRHALGASRAISLHAAPFYSWWSADDGDGNTVKKGLVRASVGADVTLFGNLGATAGIEGGQAAGSSDPGPTGAVWGVALSYAFR
jgi:hypothetical protein